MKQQRNIWR